MTWAKVCIWAKPKSLLILLLINFTLILPRAFGRQLISRWLFYFLLCYTVLTRANQLERAVHDCRILLILGLVSILSLSQSDQSCIELLKKSLIRTHRKLLKTSNQAYTMLQVQGRISHKIRLLCLPIGCVSFARCCGKISSHHRLPWIPKLLKMCLRRHRF